MSTLFLEICKLELIKKTNFLGSKVQVSGAHMPKRGNPTISMKFHSAKNSH